MGILRLLPGFWVPVLVGCLVACESSKAELSIAADGRAAVLVSCDSPEWCVRQAAKSCPRGYAVLGQGAQRGSVAVSTGQNTATSVPTYEGAVLIRCSE